MRVEGISVFTEQPVAVEVEGERISRCIPLESPRILPYLCPGFLDLQVNGFLGNDYSGEDLSAEQVRAIVGRLDRSGTTRHLPTIITSPHDRILRNLAVIVRAVETDGNIDRAIAGIHIEGPYICPEDGARGAHEAGHVRPPDIQEAREWQDAAGGRIRIITLAPEWEGALDFIERITSMGIVAAIGHTAAEPERIRAAVEAGARLSTHLGNGTHALIPRLRNPLWEQLAEDRLSAGIISDGFHLPDAVLQVFTRAKGLQRLILVSDATSPGGSAPGIYPWHGAEVRVFEDGHLGLRDTNILAGAAHLLDWDIPHFARVNGLSVGQVIPLAARNPARLIGLDPACGAIRPGAPADLLLFEHQPDQPRLQILQTIRAGNVVYSA